VSFDNIVMHDPHAFGLRESRVQRVPPIGIAEAPLDCCTFLRACSGSRSR
jgi:hypothetical protein